ncbi:MAG: PIG-L family deacetylase [Ruminococcaceae bacterium]|nr:PIG-L family deacetylase [Oscillospiraceae bacterium]MBQ6873795.1 PIG-L family deacetylase [Clostridia bacterium]
MIFDFKKNKRKASAKFDAGSAALSGIMPVAPFLCAPPSLREAKRVLFVQPHPDDNQIGAGGTIAWLISRGVECWELTVTDDRYANPEYIGKENEVETVRQKEAKAAQAYLGMKNAGFLGFADKTRATVDELSQAILKVIREIKPDFVLTVDPDLATECHSDHIKVGQAVKYACMDAMCDFYPEFIDGKPREDVHRVANIGFYYTDKPNTMIDISDYEETKMNSVACHVSQTTIDPSLMLVVRLQQQYHAQGTRYKAVEPLRLQRSLQMHCFNLPVEPIK